MTAILTRASYTDRQHTQGQIPTGLTSRMAPEAIRETIAQIWKAGRR